MLKNWGNNILEVFFLSWIGILIFLELTAPRWVVGAAFMLMASFLMILTFIPQHVVPNVNKPSSVCITRGIALVLFFIGAWVRSDFAI